MIYYLRRILNNNKRLSNKDMETIIFSDTSDVYFLCNFIIAEHDINGKIYPEAKPSFSLDFHERTAFECGAREEGFVWRRMPVKPAEFCELLTKFDGYEEMRPAEKTFIHKWLKPVEEFLNK